MHAQQICDTLPAMAGPWTFYDYVNNGGRNVIRHWVDRDVPVGAREEVRASIDSSLDLANTQKGFNLPTFDELVGKHAGLIEMRFKVAKILFRPLICEGPGESDATLLLGARKQNGSWTPHDARDTALGRRARIDEDGRICAHGWY